MTTQTEPEQSPERGVGAEALVSSADQHDAMSLSEKVLACRAVLACIALHDAISTKDMENLPVDIRSAIRKAWEIGRDA